MTQPKSKPKATTRSLTRKQATAASRKPAASSKPVRSDTKHARVIGMSRSPPGPT
jgi:hypothetical protein